MNDHEAVEFLKDLLSIYSPSHREAPLAEALAERMSTLGFAVRIDEVGNVIGERPGRSQRAMGSSALLFLGHIDTVPGFILVRVEGGRLYGRGAVDAKGPLAAFVTAVVRAAPRLKDLPLVVIGAVGEEAEGEGARQIVNRFRPAMTIVGEPSGWEGITLGYKGRLVVDYRLSTPVSHTASPYSSAPEKALRLWWWLSSYARRFNRGRSRYFDHLDISLRHINSSGDGFHSRVEMTIAMRTPPGMNAVRLQEKVAAWADGQRAEEERLSLQFATGEEAFVAQRNTPLVRAFLKSIRATGGKPRFKLKSGTSDMNVVGPVWNCPIVAYGPGDSSLDHTPNEHIEIEEYLRAIEVVEKVCYDAERWISTNR